jgi:hypothetical protein
VVFLCEYTYQSISRILTYISLLEESWDVLEADIKDMLVDVSFAINCVCTKDEKEFIRLIREGYEPKELAELYGRELWEIYYVQEKLCKKLANYLNDEKNI